MFFQKEIRHLTFLSTAICGLFLAPSLANAHFLEIIPKTEFISPESGMSLPLSLKFNHPAAGGPLMDLEMEKFAVQIVEPDQEPVTEDLLNTLTEQKVDGKRVYDTAYKIKKPGNYLFYGQQAPYWEEEEGLFIQHHTKVVVDAFDAMDGWQQEVGQTAEIIPLTRPYGIWAGQVFTGIVKHYGKPAAFTEIEVEFYSDGKQNYPAEAFVSQVVTTDANGVFTVGLPKSGWWGFAALLEANETKKSPAGEDAAIEHGAVLWVHTHDMK